MQLMPEEMNDLAVDVQPDPRSAAQSTEIKKIIETALTLLDDKYRLPLILFYMEHLKCEEIATILRIGISTVKTRLRRGRQQLRDIIKTRWPELAIPSKENHVL